jgi:hypothetical protein
MRHGKAKTGDHCRLRSAAARPPASVSTTNGVLTPTAPPTACTTERRGGVILARDDVPPGERHPCYVAHSLRRGWQSGIWSMSIGWRQVWQWPVQHLKIGCSRRTICGRVRPYAGLRWAEAFERQEPVRGGDQCGVVIPAQP